MIELNNLKGVVKKYAEERLMWTLYRSPEFFDMIRNEGIIIYTVMMGELLHTDFGNTNDNSWVGGLALLISHLQSYDPTIHSTSQARDDYANILSKTAGLLIRGYVNPDDPFCPINENKVANLTEEQWESFIHPDNYLKLVRSMPRN